MIHQRVHIGGAGEGDVLGDVLAEILEVVGVGHEVGLAVDPVSYTHLDVYKRQPWDRWRR